MNNTRALTFQNALYIALYIALSLSCLSQIFSEFVHSTLFVHSTFTDFSEFVHSTFTVLSLPDLEREIFDSNLYIEFRVSLWQGEKKSNFPELKKKHQNLPQFG